MGRAPKIVIKAATTRRCRNKTGENICADKKAEGADTKQDFLESIHLANIASVAKAEADQAILSSRVNAENKYIYQANTAQLIETLKGRFIHTCFLRRDRCRRAVQEVMDEIAYTVSPVRPDRSFYRSALAQKG